MPVRVLQVIGVMDRAGAETLLMNLMRAADPTRMRFDFLVHEEREGDYDAEIRSLGGAVYRVPHFNIVNAVRYRRAVRAFFREHSGYDIVHAHMPSTAAIDVGEARAAGIATVAHSHAQNMLPTMKQLAYDALMVWPLRGRADEYLACSREAGIDRFGEAIAGGGHFHVLPNAIAVDEYRCDEEGHLRAKAELGYAGIPLVGHVGRFTDVKNHRFLLEVFKLMLRECPSARLLLLGRGPLEQEVRAHAGALGIAESVEFCGLRDDVPRYLKAMDAFVFPSKHEGLSNAMVEAQAAGVPCITSTGVPLAAICASSTLRIPLEDGVEAWARAALALMDDAPPREEGADSVVSHGYDIAASADWMTAFYEQLNVRHRAEQGRR